MPRPRMRTLVRDKEHRDWAVWLDEHHCRHGHTYMNHFGCYEKEHPTGPIQERIGFLDIEATNLKANFGVVICWCIKPNKSRKIIQACVTPREMKKGDRDKRIIEELGPNMRRFDRLVVHYGTNRKFDFPYLRSRALRMNLDFPKYKELWVTDTWNIAKNKLCLSSNRLATIAEFLHIKMKKTPITTEHWLDALSGRKESLAYILDHCDRDVLVLEAVYNKLWHFAPRSKTSI